MNALLTRSPELLREVAQIQYRGLNQYHLQQVIKFHPETKVIEECRELLKEALRANEARNSKLRIDLARYAAVRAAEQAHRDAVVIAKKQLNSVLKIRSTLVLNELAEWELRGRTGKIRGVFVNNKSTPTDHRELVLACLRKLCVNYTVSNDAPRGGQCGWYAIVGGGE